MGDFWDYFVMQTRFNIINTMTFEDVTMLVTRPVVCDCFLLGEYLQIIVKLLKYRALKE